MIPVLHPKVQCQVSVHALNPRGNAVTRCRYSMPRGDLLDVVLDPKSQCRFSMSLVDVLDTGVYVGTKS